MVTRSLEENAGVKAHIVKCEGKSVLQACKAVSEDFPVSRIFCSIFSDAELLVNIEVKILEVSGHHTTAHT